MTTPNTYRDQNDDLLDYVMQTQIYAKVKNGRTWKERMKE
jgi:hypothetical protein